MIFSLVQVINFATAKTWQYPRISVDISTSKCFFCRGTFFVAIATTPNLRCKSDNVLYFIRCLSRRYIHAQPSLYPRWSVAVSTLSRRCIHGCEILKKNCRRCIHGYNCFKKKNTNAIRPIPCGSRSEASHTLESYVEQRVRRGQFRRLFVV